MLVRVGNFDDLPGVVKTTTLLRVSSVLLVKAFRCYLCAAYLLGRLRSAYGAGLQ